MPVRMDHAYDGIRTAAAVVRPEEALVVQVGYALSSEQHEADLTRFPASRG